MKATVSYRAPRPRVRYVVKGRDGIQDVFDRLKDGILAVDTETSGLDWWVDRVGALCFAAGDTAAFFCKDALAPAARWLGDQVKRHRPFVFHHAKFDMHMIRSSFGVHIPYPVHDTMLMSHMLDNRGAPINKYPWFAGHHLKDLAAAFVDPTAHEPEEKLMQLIKEVGGRRAHKGDWLIVPLKHSAKYGALDPWYTLMLYDQFIERIRYWPQPPGYPALMELYKTERWLTLALRDMEERGIMADADFLETWARKVKKDIRRSQKRLNRMVAERIQESMGWDSSEFNWNSPKQVSELLFDTLGIPPISGRSTDKRSLLRMNDPVASELLKHRSGVKSYTAFAKTLLSKIKPDRAIHTHFNQNVGTGRMSAADPNLQQQARDSGVRAAFIPRKGLVLRSADYSQIEMRFAAHFSDEQVLIEGFNNDPDFDTHAALARRMFGLGRKGTPTSQQRDRGKTMNFAMLYGAGEEAVTEQLIDKVSFKEARQSCIELGYRPKRSESPYHVLAQLLRNAVRESYPKMWKFTKDEEKIAAKRGFVVDAFGYHRYLDEDECYKAMNSKVQGSAAHQAKVGLVNVYRELQLGTGEVAILLQVHDDIIYESEGDPRTDARVLDLLEERKRFKVPMLADLKGSAVNWQVKEKVKVKRIAA